MRKFRVCNSCNQCHETVYINRLQYICSGCDPLGFNREKAKQAQRESTEEVVRLFNESNSRPEPLPTIKRPSKNVQNDAI